jgi:two-component system OmpR family response regulator
MRLSPPRRSPDAAPIAGARSESECRACLHGDLQQLSLATLLTVLDMERRSGFLLIRRGRELGKLWLRAGRVIRARIEGSAKLAGKIAVYDLLAWGEGRFELDSADVEGADELDTPTTHLLMEAARRMDEGGAALEF